MQYEEPQIINIAVNIFQNVGIKRYIGSIEALMHEDIYFEIYKIIFPDSMINIFKISDSSLTTGEKIQKIINEISSIIGLDLYHIQGEAIAQGNMNHLTNWLQLLEALSARCVPAPGYPRGGSAPDRDHQQDVDFSDDDYYTVLGINKQFENHGYSQDDGNTHKQETDEDYCPYILDEPYNNNRKFNQNKQIKEKEIKNKKNHQPQIYDDQNRFNGTENDQDKDSSLDSNLKPISDVNKPSKTKNKKNRSRQDRHKHVTFKLQSSPKQTKTTKSKINRNSENMYNKKISNNLRDTCASSSGHQIQRIYSKKTIEYPQIKQKKTGDKLLKKKLRFINKMHQVIEQMEQTKINEQSLQFQNWVESTNQQAFHEHMKIQQENQLRTELINAEINERDQIVDSLLGQQQAISDIKSVFRAQKRNEKNFKKFKIQQIKRQAQILMDENFAQDVHRLIMSSLNE